MKALLDATPASSRAQNSAGQRMVNLLFHQFFGVPDSSPDVFRRHVVLAADLLKTHAAGQATQHAGHGHARAADDRLTVLHLWIHNDAIVHSSELSVWAESRQTICPRCPDPLAINTSQSSSFNKKRLIGHSVTSYNN